MDATAGDYHMLTVDALHAAVAGEGAERVLTLDRGFQGLPDTAHGGSVLALFDLVAGPSGARCLEGHYLKRVPVASPLALRVRRDGGGCHLEVAERETVLVRGEVRPITDTGGSPLAPPAADALALPISRTCFACGLDNPLGLGATLRADDAIVGGTWTPRPGFATRAGTLSSVALTTLLDEAAFWLGALATGEAGMTTQLRVVLHAPADAGATISIAGERAAVRPREGDPRYTETFVSARSGDGRLVASAAITFVAVRGTARRLVNGMLAVNPPELLRRVFPAYTPAA
jgi:hypothetical protein